MFSFDGYNQHSHWFLFQSRKGDGNKVTHYDPNRSLNDSQKGVRLCHPIAFSPQLITTYNKIHYTIITAYEVKVCKIYRSIYAEEQLTLNEILHENSLSIGNRTGASKIKD